MVTRAKGNAALAIEEETVAITINENDEVWTSDDFKLGRARSWHYRPEKEVYPGEQLYAVYLKVENFELGDTSRILSWGTLSTCPPILSRGMARAMSGCS
jgi:hypothetical protein